MPFCPLLPDCYCVGQIDSYFFCLAELRDRSDFVNRDGSFGGNIYFSLCPLDRYRGSSILRYQRHGGMVAAPTIAYDVAYLPGNSRQDFCRVAGVAF